MIGINIRNIIESDILNEIHEKIIDKINNEKVILNLKVFLFQLYSAYKQIVKMGISESIKIMYSDALEKALQISTEKN